MVLHSFWHDTAAMETPPSTPIEPELCILEDCKLGSGASGLVYLCRYNDRKAAIMLFPNASEVKKYVQKARMLKKLRHRNITQFYAILYNITRAKSELSSTMRSGDH